MATRACITSAAGTSRATRARFATACDLFVSRYATWKLARGCCYFRGEQNAAFHAVCCVWDGGRCIRRATHTALSGSLRRAPGYASFATGLPRSTALSGRLQLAVVFSWFSGIVGRPSRNFSRGRPTRQRSLPGRVVAVAVAAAVEGGVAAPPGVEVCRIEAPCSQSCGAGQWCLAHGASIRPGTGDIRVRAASCPSDP
jgi:hypothetical protein